LRVLCPKLEPLTNGRATVHRKKGRRNTGKSNKEKETQNGEMKTEIKR
jgi:hypothetical protein